jgi:hypothetical protein
MINTLLQYIVVLWFLIPPSHASSKLDLNCEKGDPYLYEVRPKNYDVHSGNIYLLGSNHVVPTEYLHTVTNYIVNRADILVTELGNSPSSKGLFNFIDVPINAMKMLGLIAEKPWGWFQELDTDQQSFLTNKYKDIVQEKWHVSLDQIHPSVFNNILKSLYHVTISPQDDGMDHELENAFEELKKPILNLENGLVRILCDNAVSKFSEKNPTEEVIAIKYFINALKDAKKLEKPVNFSTVNRYLEGEMSRLISSVHNQTVQKRNLIWIPVMKDILEKNPGKNIVFCFGCGHLPGETGILSLLKKEGYDLIRFSKKGHKDTALKSFCNYTQGYTYFDLMLEGLQEVILKQPLPKNSSHAELAKKKIQEDYDFALKLMIEFSNPDKANSTLSSSAYHRFNQLLTNVVNNFEQQPHHKMLQLEDDRYYNSYLFSTDLNQAYALAKKYAYQAKENGYKSFNWDV